MLVLPRLLSLNVRRQLAFLRRLVLLLAVLEAKLSLLLASDDLDLSSNSLEEFEDDGKTDDDFEKTDEDKVDGREDDGFEEEEGRVKEVTEAVGEGRLAVGVEGIRVRTVVEMVVVEARGRRRRKVRRVELFVHVVTFDVLRPEWRRRWRRAVMMTVARVRRSET